MKCEGLGSHFECESVQSILLIGPFEQGPRTCWGRATTGMSCPMSKSAVIRSKVFRAGLVLSRLEPTLFKAPRLSQAVSNLVSCPSNSCCKLFRHEAIPTCPPSSLRYVEVYNDTLESKGEALTRMIIKVRDANKTKWTHQLMQYIQWNHWETNKLKCILPNSSLGSTSFILLGVR